MGMHSYKTVTRLTDYGPYIVKLILELDCDAGPNDVTPDVWNVYVERRNRDGSIVMHKDWGEPRARPSAGYPAVRRAYPCDENGAPAGRSAFVALELEEELLNKRIEGDVMASCYVDNVYRVTQLKALPAPDGGDPRVGAVFDTCSAAPCPALNGWAGGRSSHASMPLRYGWYTPKNPDKKKLPLLVWLHGAGEGGDDVRVTYTGNRVTALSGLSIQRKLGGAAWVLAPQCPTVWMDDGKEKLGRSNRSIYTEPLKACIDQFIAAHADTIDPDRVYISGISNGGFMTVRMLLDYPGFFAAAAPGCQAFYSENITDTMLDSLKATPIWLTHAKNDELVDPRETSLPLYHRLKAAGAPNVHMTFWDEVADLTGQYRDELGRPMVTFNHGVWVAMLNDACRVDLDGTRVMQDGEPLTLWEWVGRQHR